MDRKIFYNKEAQSKLLDGVYKLYSAVKVTLGAKGKTVIIEDKEGGGAHITKDGVTVAKSITVPQEVERVAVDVVKTVALRTNEQAGDGTSTSIVLASNIIKRGFEVINKEDCDVNKLLKGIKLATKDVISVLKEEAVPIDGNLKYIEDVATVSGNNDIRVGKLVSEAYSKVNFKGIVTVDDSRRSDSYIEVDSGMKLRSGLVSSSFITNWTKGVTVHNEPAIIITDFDIKNLNNMDGLLTKLFEESRPVVLVCDNIDPMPLQILLKIKQYKGHEISVLKAPSFGEEQHELLQDLAIVTGGKLYSKEYGDTLSSIRENGLGRCKSFEATIDNSFFYEGFGDKEKIETRIKELRTKKCSEEEQKRNKERALFMDGGSATIYVGAWSDIERVELKDRAIDAVHAVRAALEEGVVPGGGSTLYHIGKNLIDKHPKDADTYIGYKLLCESIEAPLSQILYNGGITNYDEILEGKPKNIGIDVLTGKAENMIEKGIIDPVKVVRVALKNAVSVSSTLLTTECVVSNLYSDDDTPTAF